MNQPGATGSPLGKKPLIYDLDFEALASLMSSWGEPVFRARQVWTGLYRSLWDGPESFTNLSNTMRARLAGNFSFSHLSPLSSQVSSKGDTRKTLFLLPDQQAIEAVMMGYSHRQTLCISTQAGCAIGCVFCATGQMGFRRNLTSGEIIEQVLVYARQLKENRDKVSNVVLMGMGEPFHNYDATLNAIDRLNHPEGFNLGARRFTISTVGLVPQIRRFTQERRQVNLAVSLHAADDELRSSMLPINRKYPLSELMDACREYVQYTHRRITFEWALIRDVNDSPDQAHRLAALAGDMLCHVNVIPLNPTRRYSGQGTTRERASAFKAALESHGIACTIRLRRGIDIQAGCGQLAAEKF
jgi:23S rRNA (adenine2503-C2)-methyltransferase